MRKIWNYLVGLAVAFMVLQWIACGWEHSTGLTFATRNRRGQPASEAHLAATSDLTKGATVIGACAGLTWVLTRKKEN